MKISKNMFSSIQLKVKAYGNCYLLFTWCFVFLYVERFPEEKLEIL